MDYKHIHTVVSGLEFTEDELVWIKSVANNPIMDKLAAALLSVTLEEERGIFKKSLSPEEVSSILQYNHIYREVVGDLKSDMLSVSNVNTESDEEEQEELPLTHIASGENLAYTKE